MALKFVRKGNWNKRGEELVKWLHCKSSCWNTLLRDVEHCSLPYHVLDIGSFQRMLCRQCKNPYMQTSSGSLSLLYCCLDKIHEQMQLKRDGGLLWLPLVEIHHGVCGKDSSVDNTPAVKKHRYECSCVASFDLSYVLLDSNLWKGAIYI